MHANYFSNPLRFYNVEIVFFCLLIIRRLLPVYGFFVAYEKMLLEKRKKKCLVSRVMIALKIMFAMRNVVWFVCEGKAFRVKIKYICES